MFKRSNIFDMRHIAFNINIANGVRLGWLIDPLEQKVYVYHAGGEPEILENPEIVSGEDILKGFELNVREIW